MGIIPGPKEPSPDQVQCYMRPLVNDLLHLWEDGIVIKTAKSPYGRCVHAVLLCIVCDAPAAHKLGGFGSHSHTMFCTRCWVTLSQKHELEALQVGGTSYQAYHSHTLLTNLRFSTPY